MKKREIIFAVIIAVFLVIFLSPLASKLPDGLNKVAQDKGFLEKTKTLSPPVIPGYLFPGIKNEKLSVIIAGIFGVAIAFFISYLLAALIKKSKGIKSFL